MHEILLNSTSLKWTHCQRRYALKVIDGYVSTEDNEYLTFGSALHHYAELRAKRVSPANALAQAIMLYRGKDTDALTRACVSFPPMLVPPYVDSSGTPYIEHRFKCLWREGADYRIYVCGTFDVVGQTSDGAVRIVDYKSTRRYKQAEVFHEYRVSSQMAFYLWAAQRFAHEIFDMQVGNAAYAGKIFLQVCPVFLSYDPIQWKPGPLITLPNPTEFEAHLTQHVDQVILPAWRASQSAPTGQLNNTCNNCEFVDYCFAETLEGEAAALAQFKQEKYDPTKWH